MACVLLAISDSAAAGLARGAKRSLAKPSVPFGGGQAGRSIVDRCAACVRTAAVDESAASDADATSGAA